MDLGVLISANQGCFNTIAPRRTQLASGIEARRAETRLASLRARLGREATRARRALARDAHLDALLDIAANILRRFLITDDLKRVCWKYPGLDRFNLLRRRVQPFFAGGLID